MAVEPIVITGAGMVTAVGWHATQTAASVRAGFNRFRAWPHGRGRCEGLAAAFVDPDLGDRPWTEKVFSLLSPAVEEALLQAGLCERARLEPLAARSRLQVLVTCPPPVAPGTRRLDPSLAVRLGSGLLPDGVGVALDLLPEGSGGLAAALAAATRALREERADVVLVAGVDSWLQSDRLEALAGADRLKLPEETTGTIPGEGAACLVLEAAGQARARGQAELVRILGVGQARQAAYAPEAPTSAEGLVACAEAAAAQAGGLAGFERVCLDLNGERWRFLEWALASGRLGDRLARGWRLTHPADCWGDVGAAFGPLTLALAAQAWARGAWTDSRALVLCTPDGGERHAVALARPERR